MKRLFLCLLILFSALSLLSCSASAQTNESFAMDTVIRQTVYAPDDTVIKQNNQILRALEDATSKTIETSDIARLNAANDQDVELSAETARILELCLEEAQRTDGAFHPALGTIMSAWGFGTENTRVPDKRELEQLLLHTDYTNITVNGTQANAGGTQIDLGGAVKGYALGKIAENLEQNNVSAAIISLGGSIYAKGTKPDGSKFKVGIRDPFGSENDYMGTISLDGSFVSTSGIYSRGFEQDGAYYHHLIDPKTGMPVENNLESVTVVSPAGILSDIYSTALFVMGPEQGLKFAQQNGIDALYLTRDKQILATDGFAQKYEFAIKNQEYQE